jgi:hypothetical protein
MTHVEKSTSVDICFLHRFGRISPRVGKEGKSAKFCELAGSVGLRSPRAEPGRLLPRFLVASSHQVKCTSFPNIVMPRRQQEPEPHDVDVVPF